MVAVLFGGNESHLCATEDCHRTVYAKGFCQRCYMRQHRTNGQTSRPKPAATAPLSDEILTAVAAGTQDAIALIAAHWRRPLQAFALRYLHDSGVADEVVQDTFIALWQHASAIGDAAHLRGWLFRVCVNKCMDIHRKRTYRRKHGESVSLEDVSPTDLQEPDFAENLVDALDGADHVKRVLGELSAASRQILLLDAEGLTFKEMAARLGIPLGTVKSRLNYAKGRAQAVARKLRSA